jgi:hypothetical protein
MEFLALLVGDDTRTPPGTPEFDALMIEYNKFAEVAGEAIKSGEPLQTSNTAHAIRPSAGEEPLVTQGPFTETTEVMGGFYVLDVESLDEAVDLAGQIPWAKTGKVEVRPIVHLNSEDTSTGDGARYLAAIFSPETPAEIPGTPEWDAGSERHGQFMDKHASSIMGGLALHPVATATTVQVRDGERIVTDGPYAETTEVVGGFYLLKATTPEAAVEVAKDIPLSPGGGIEVRPILEIPR